MSVASKSKAVSLANRTPSPPLARSRQRERLLTPGRARELLEIAASRGLLRGTRTKVVRGRMPGPLVEKAKSRTGISSDTKLLEVALANLAVGDDYADWLISRRGTIPKDIDLGW
jgi:hypothetical protein